MIRFEMRLAPFARERDNCRQIEALTEGTITPAKSAFSNVFAT